MSLIYNGNLNSSNIEYIENQYIICGFGYSLNIYINNNSEYKLYK